MDEICQTLLARLKNAGIPEVYPAFDAVPLKAKSAALFTVLSIRNMQCGEGYPAEGGAVYPFTADVRADLLAPMTADAQELLQYFFVHIVPAMLGADCLCLRFDAGMPKVDVKMQKMVFGGEFRLNGAFYVSETEETA